ncbi:hypothetical protein GHK62_01345 [Sinorhizobium terangae]|uniref:Transcriptional regulator n=1 Tax=Sinorhizobium terangae TaxID=110322 RepID=A0A6N7L6D0_SINTE|nr:hypothetical protein [Sinorhizobium terangae]
MAEKLATSALDQRRSTSADELALLDAENKRLRQLLANQLRAQNAELKKMLERF